MSFFWFHNKKFWHCPETKQTTTKERKMKRKLVFVGISLLILVLSFTACTEPNDGKTGGKSNQELADEFKSDHSAILGKTVDTVQISDETAVDAALTAYNALAQGVKDLLTAEKALLDNLKSKIATMKMLLPHTITFNPNGGTGGPDPATATYGQPLPTITVKPTREAYYFAGYYDAQTGGTEYYTADLAPAEEQWDKTSNTTLYAKWTAAPVHNIVFHSNDGSHQTVTQEIPENTTAALRTNTFTRDSRFTFYGWSTTTTGSVEYTNGQNFTAGSGVATINLYAIWNLLPNQYLVGDTGPGGGIIYYFSETGFTVQMVDTTQNYTAHYLEVAPTKVSDSFVQWGDDGTLIDGITTNTNSANIETIDYIGVGRKDTQLIVTHMENKSISGTAAQLCISYSNGGLNDWFLPSLAEFYALYTSGVSGMTDIFDFPNKNYWSSSQEGTRWAWCIFFHVDFRDNHGKSNETYVRAIRAF
jgi:hypothetical protein